MHDYTIDLALFDYLPIMLSMAALLILSEISYQKSVINGRLARLGAGLIVSGGLLKASWKLIVASTGEHIPWMNNALFILMAPGFVIFVSALTLHLRTTTQAAIPIAAAAAVIGVAAALHLSNPDSRSWFFWLLTVTTLSNATMIFALVKRAWQQKLAVSGSLFLINFIATLALSGLARLPDQTAALQWIEEGINTGAQLSLLIASIQLYKSSASIGKGEPV